MYVPACQSRKPGEIMKLIRIFALAALVAARVFSAATADDKDPIDPRHGGLVSKANHLEIELVATAGAMQVYLRDHGKPVQADGGSAKLTLLGSPMASTPTAAMM